MSEKHKDVLLPGYTHAQIAMPSSFGLWFGAYAEALVDDMQMLRGAWKVVDCNPLGSAAGYGSSFPLYRQMTTDLLGFGTLNYNVVGAQLSRGKSERAVASALGAIALTLNKFASDCCMYMCPNYGFIKFPDSLTTGSSIMPVLELMHKCLSMAKYMLDNIMVNDHILDAPIYEYLFTVEEVNRRALKGMPFRDAYKSVGIEANEGRFHYVPAAGGDKKIGDLKVSDLNHVSLGSMGNICTDRIAAKMRSAAEF